MGCLFSKFCKDSELIANDYNAYVYDGPVFHSPIPSGSGSVGNNRITSTPQSQQYIPDIYLINQNANVMHNFFGTVNLAQNNSSWRVESEDIVNYVYDTNENGYVYDDPVISPITPRRNLVNNNRITLTPQSHQYVSDIDIVGQVQDYSQSGDHKTVVNLQRKKNLVRNNYSLRVEPIKDMNVEEIEKKILSKIKSSSSNKIIFYKGEMLTNPITSEYDEINSHFMKTQHHYKVQDIKKIINPYVKSAYLMRKKECEILCGAENVKVELVFHGTKAENVDNIINNNFNWRLHGKAKGNIFGQGVSFSPISNYASNYCDKTEQKTMLAVAVIKCHTCNGQKSMVVPPMYDSERQIFYDTTEKPGGAVCVKYKDDEFYPMYLIHFTGSPIKKKN